MSIEFFSNLLLLNAINIIIIYVANDENDLKVYIKLSMKKKQYDKYNFNELLSTFVSLVYQSYLTDI